MSGVLWISATRKAAFFHLALANCMVRSEQHQMGTRTLVKL
jgi:hypothetical protein